MKTIKIESKSKVVEYEKNGRIRRVILPVDSDNVSLGIPYGLPLVELLQQAGMTLLEAETQADKLHRQGIWTEADLTPELTQLLRIRLPNNGVPDVSKLDWQAITVTLAELLTLKELFTMADVQQNPRAFQWCIKTALTKPLLELYRSNEDDNS